MAEMSTMPVYKCRYCGKPLVVTHFRTTVPDPDGTLFYKVIAGLGNAAICEDCRNTYNYYAIQNRAGEMLLNPAPILLKVYDPRGNHDRQS